MSNENDETAEAPSQKRGFSYKEEFSIRSKTCIQ